MLAKVFLEISSLCNLSCSFCPPTRRKGEFLARGLFELFLERIAGTGDHLYFHLKGEPLLHPELEDFLALAGARGFAVTITTNGTLVGERAEALLGSASLRKLSVSLHSHSGAPDPEGYWRGVEAFLDAHRRKPAFPVSLRLWNRSEGLLPPETARLWELLRARYPALGPWDPAASLPAGTRLGHRVYLNPAEEFAWPDLSLPAEGRRGFCLALRNQAGVLVDGTVVPCCLDGEGAMALGNLRDAPLRDILASPRARAIYEGFSRRELVEPLCGTCGYRRKFGEGGMPAAKV